MNRHRFQLRLSVLALSVLGLFSTPAALAQSAGMQLQQPLPPQPQPTPEQAMPTVPANPAVTPDPTRAAMQVTLRSVVFSGNRELSSDTLAQALGPLEGRRFDLAGLEALAARVVQTYRENGHPFVLASLPPQNLQDGQLRIQVLEGRFGQISVVGDDPLVPGAQPFLDRQLQRGNAIHNQPLERAMLLLDDQPGFRVSPLLRPGQGAGEGDLVVRVERRSHHSAEIGLDNTGSQATGEHRLRGQYVWNSPWRFGDRVTVNAMTTDRQLWLGSVDYDAPVGADGLRAQVGLAYTSYQLDQGFASLNASGRAQVLSTRLSWAARRSQATNLLLTLGLQLKRPHDRFDSVNLVRDKRTRLLNAGLQFDHKDHLGGGGVTYGAASLSAGHLQLDADTAQADALTARSAGSFQKLNLDVTRIQKLPAGFSLYGRWSGQWAAKNLDASEKFGLGGFLGVRAYPLGEASGDTGWLSQLELRHGLGTATVFVLADNGKLRINAKPWDAAAANRRQLAGVGLGLRWGLQGWSVEGTVSSRTQGGAPTSQNDDKRPRVFVSVSRRFD